MIPIQFHHASVASFGSSAVDVAHDRSAPAWAAHVERWYQLDWAAYAFAETFWRIQPPSRPDLLLLASASASNATDFEFVKSGSTSAAKFVHTLPNIRGTSLYQVMNWSGPMLCFQNGDTTLLSALAEAIDEFLAKPREIWLFSVGVAQDVYFFRFLPHDSQTNSSQFTATRQYRAAATLAPASKANIGKIDNDFMAWLSHPELKFKWSQGSFEWTLDAIPKCETSTERTNRATSL